MKYTCPSCGYFVFDEPPGSYSICAICFWEDDATQLRFPDLAGGANKVSLIDAQKNFQEFGASEKRLSEHVRKPTSEDQRDPQWRMVDLTKDTFEETKIKDGKEYFDAVLETGVDPSKLYYWKK